MVFKRLEGRLIFEFFMKKYLFLPVFLIFTGLFAFAVPSGGGRGGQELLSPGHWIYDSLQKLEQECAIVQFSDQAPLSLMQVRALLQEIDYDSLSAAGRIQYDRITGFFKETAFSANASVLQIRVEPALNFEGYVKTSDDAFWIYDRFCKKHFLEFPVTLSAGDCVSLYADLFAGINKTASQDNDTFVNIPYNETNFDVNFPHEAYGSFGYAFNDTVGVNFRITNMSQSFGRASLGSVIQSEYMTDATNAVLTIYSPLVQYTAGLTALNTNRYMYSHKLDMRLGKKVQLSFMEACLPYGPMDLRFFNPMMIMHNYASWLDYQAQGSDVGSYFGIKLNVAPVKYFRAYALWAMTQFQLSVELDDNDSNFDNYVPNAMGWQLGLESYLPYKEGHFHFNIEGLYVQPYMYINSSPNWSFVRTSSESNSGSANFYEWLGTRYGPDSVAAKITAGYENEKWEAGFKYLFLARGELSEPGIFERVGWGPRVLDVGTLKDWVYPYHIGDDGKKEFSDGYKDGRHKVAPSGTPEFANVISVYGSYNLNRWLKFTLQPSFAILTNVNHKTDKNAFSFECAFGVQIKITKISKGVKRLAE